MADQEHEKQPAPPAEADDKSSLHNEAEAERLAKSAAKRRTLINWMRVIALLFAGFFFLSQCGMSKHQAIAKIVESCIQNVPAAPKWQADLKARGLEGQGDKVIADYCTCMWERPLDKLSDKQIRSFSKISAQEQLKLLGGADAFEERDRQCVANLKVR